MRVPCLVTSVLVIGLAGCQTGTKPHSALDESLAPETTVRTVSLSMEAVEVAAGAQDRKDDPLALPVPPTGSERLPIWVTESILSHEEHLALEAARTLQGDPPDDILQLDDLRRFPFDQFPLELGGRKVSVKWQTSKGIGITAKIKM